MTPAGAIPIVLAPIDPLTAAAGVILLSPQHTEELAGKLAALYDSMPYEFIVTIYLRQLWGPEATWRDQVLSQLQSPFAPKQPRPN